MRIEDRLFLNRFKSDTISHLKVLNPNECLKCVNKQCTYTCPAKCYTLDDLRRVSVAYEGCVECGTCRIVCNEFRNIGWEYPRGGFGVMYKFG